MTGASQASIIDRKQRQHNGRAASTRELSKEERRKKEEVRCRFREGKEGATGLEELSNHVQRDRKERRLTKIAKPAKRLPPGLR